MSTGFSFGGAGSALGGAFGSSNTNAFGSNPFSTGASGTGAFGSPAPSTGTGFSGTPASATTGTIGGFGSIGGATNPFGGGTLSGAFGTSTATSGGFGGTSGTTGFGTPTISTGTGLGGVGFGSLMSAPSTQMSFGTSSGGSNSFGFGTSSNAIPTGGNPFGNSGLLSTQSALASSAQPTTSFGGFGNAPTSGFGAPTFGGGMSMSSQQATIGQSNAETNTAARIREIQQLYAPSIDQTGKYIATDNVQGTIPNRACEFRTVMYRFKARGTSTNSSRPEGVSMLKWEQMERDNPDPELLCPVVELGIHALKRRYEHQNMESKVLQSYVTEMNDSLKLIETSISKIDIRFSGLKSKQSILYNRLLAILSKIEVLRNRNVPLSENEIRLYRRIQQMMQELQVPHNKLLALMNTQSHLSKKRAVVTTDLTANDLRALKQTLLKQREMIENLTGVMSKDQKTLDFIARDTSKSK